MARNLLPVVGLVILLAVGTLVSTPPTRASIVVPSPTNGLVSLGTHVAHRGLSDTVQQMRYVQLNMVPSMIIMAGPPVEVKFFNSWSNISLGLTPPTIVSVATFVNVTSACGSVTCPPAHVLCNGGPIFTKPPIPGTGWLSNFNFVVIGPTIICTSIEFQFGTHAYINTTFLSIPRYTVTWVVLTQVTTTVSWIAAGTNSETYQANVSFYTTGYWGPDTTTYTRLISYLISGAAYVVSLPSGAWDALLTTVTLARTGVPFYQASTQLILQWANQAPGNSTYAFTISGFPGGTGPGNTTQLYPLTNITVNLGNRTGTGGNDYQVSAIWDNTASPFAFTGTVYLGGAWFLTASNITVFVNGAPVSSYDGGSYQVVAPGQVNVTNGSAIQIIATYTANPSFSFTGALAIINSQELTVSAAVFITGLVIAFFLGFVHVTDRRRNVAGTIVGFLLIVGLVGVWLSLS